MLYYDLLTLVMSSSKKRACSLCRLEGHNRRTCPSKQSKRARGPVFVHVKKEGTPSQHIVNLRTEHEGPSLRDIPTYQERPAAKTTRVEVNFGKIIHAQRKRDLATLQPEFHGIDRMSEVEMEVEVEPSLDQERTSFRPNFSLPIFSLPAIPRYEFRGMRATAFALILLLIAVIPFPAYGYYQKVKDDSALIVEQSTNAFLALQSSTVAALNSNIDQAQFDLNQALASFHAAQTLVEKDHQALFYVASVLPVLGKQVQSRQDVLQAGHHLALGNTYLLKGIQASKNVDATPTERLTKMQIHLRAALPQYKTALEHLSGVESSALPAEYQASFDDFKLLYAAFLDDLNDLEGLLSALNSMLGEDSYRQYLIVGQNNHELRATGGFIGSMAILSIQKGNITRLEVPGGGPYDLQGQLGVYLKPPVPLQVLNERWEFQDANWFPDFAESARKMEFFYEQSRGETFDGVIAVNASVLERILTVLGPVAIEGTDLTISADNALATLQQEVEIDYDKEANTPKAVIGSALDSIIANLEEGVASTDLVLLLAELTEAFEQKEIQVYMHDETLQDTFRSFGWSGEIQKTDPDQDYLMVVSTNIGGEKSDAKISQEIEHQVVIGEDGSITNTVLIRRTHTGESGELFYGAANLSYLRVYVPEGSQLIEAQGFDFPPEELFRVPEQWYREDSELAQIEQEESFDRESGMRISHQFGKTAFGHWMAVAPGETSEAYIRYTLPFTLSDLTDLKKQRRFTDLILSKQKEAATYSLFVQKQSGINADFYSTIILPEQWRPTWKADDRITFAQNGALIHERLLHDALYGFVLEKK